MTKFSPILRVLLVAGFVLAAVAIPWVRAGLPVDRAEGVRLGSVTTGAETQSCCCTADQPCPCCVSTAHAVADAQASTKPCSECRCGDNPTRDDAPSVFLLLTGVTPVGWRPPTPVEIVTAPATPIATVFRILAGCLPVTDTARRLALTGVRTT